MKIKKRLNQKKVGCCWGGGEARCFNRTTSLPPGWETRCFNRTTSLPENYYYPNQPKLLLCCIIVVVLYYCCCVVLLLLCCIIVVVLYYYCVVLLLSSLTIASRKRKCSEVSCNVSHRLFTASCLKSNSCRSCL